MKGKNKLIAVVVMLVLVVQMTGCGGVAASGSENVINTWAGYEADAANGLRVKSVEFRTDQYPEYVSKVTYDVEGNIMSSCIYHLAYEPFFKKALGISVPFICGQINLSYKPTRSFFRNKEAVIGGRKAFGTLVMIDPDFYYILQVDNDGRYVLVSNDRSESIYFLTDGRFIQKTYVDNSAEEPDYGEGLRAHIISSTDKSNYDNKGRVTEYSVKELSNKKDGMTYTHVGNVRYTYEGDSSYLASLVFNNSKTTVRFLKRTYEYDYDDNHNIVRVEEYSFTDPDDLYGTFTDLWEYEYDENGNVVCETKVEGSDQGDIVTMTRYQYDNDGNMIEECKYQTFGSEEYMTSKTEYQYVNAYAYQTRTTLYKYEANSDYSIVNLTETVEGNWGELTYGTFFEGYDEVNDCWTVTYYTQEEIDQYWHDQEFQSIN